MNGHCLCGAVQLTSRDTREIGACHCGFCRRWGGGPLLTEQQVIAQFPSPGGEIPACAEP